MKQNEITRERAIEKSIILYPYFSNEDEIRRIAFLRCYDWLQSQQESASVENSDRKKQSQQTEDNYELSRRKKFERDNDIANPENF